jgi:hypothetical protein|tara:strand:+ start:271 stop:534 length:264 start_codon:yes stop_codon:yes gene_type:complete
MDIPVENKNYAASEAIKRSVSHDECVTIEYDNSTYSDLMHECEDHVEVEDYEYVNGSFRRIIYEDIWGTTLSGEEWRVHVLINRADR